MMGQQQLAIGRQLLAGRTIPHMRRTCGLLLCLLALSVSARAASLPPTESTTGLVVSAQRLATEVGADILRKGGNAVDAAVAVGYAEAVVNPCCGNIGGGGFMTAHLADGRNIFLNFRETAPAAATRDMYLDGRGEPVPTVSLYRLEGCRRSGHRARASTPR